MTTEQTLAIIREQAIKWTKAGVPDYCSSRYNSERSYYYAQARKDFGRKILSLLEGALLKEIR